ncbi:MAG: hypothetical protein ACREP2_02075, partial [Rhodanobacteraceae bacterium]
FSLSAAALAALAGTAMASSGSLIQFKSQVLPVVVQVNAEGKVTDILPARQLPPQVSRLLVEQLDAWIVKPLMVKGHPVATRFIAEVAMRTKPLKNGKYAASFVYVKGLPMPFGGAVSWNVINGGLEVALVSADNMAPRHEWRMPYDTAGYPQSSVAATRAQPNVRGGAVYGQAMPSAMGRAQSMPAMVAPAAPAGRPNAAASGAPRTEIP